MRGLGHLLGHGSRPLLRCQTWLAIPYGFTRSILTRAYAEGPKEPPLLEDTVPGHFEKIVHEYGDRTAVVSSHQKQGLTYYDLNRKANSVAQGLQDVGVKKGDRVGVMLGNNIEYAIATYAIFKLGAILVPLNPAFGPSQVTSALNKLSASHLIISTETNIPFKPPRANLQILDQIISDPFSRGQLSSHSIPSLRHIIIVENSSGRVDITKYNSVVPFVALEGASTGIEAPSPQSPLQPSEVINIQFTSGTTAMPKAACLTHRSILNNGYQIGSRMLLTSDDRVVCPPPLFHCFGCILGYMATVTHGSAIIFPSEAFSPSAALRAVIDERGTALYGVPTMFISEFEELATNLERYPLEGFSHLRTGIAAGSPVPAELMRKLHQVLNLTDLTICYGMTETSPVSCMTTTDDPLEQRISTVGRPLPHVKVKVVDPLDRSKILNVGERGELVVSGYLTMRGYWNDEQKTAEVLVKDEYSEDWMHTGDEAVIDGEGYVAITGRIKDLIIRGGENIHPLEIENCLLSHPAVSDASVVGVADQKYGEAVGAFIIRKNKSPQQGHDQDGASGQLEQDLRNHVKKNLSHHLVPKYVFFVNEYPKTPSGKVQKYKLRDMAMAILEEDQTN